MRTDWLSARERRGAGIPPVAPTPPCTAAALRVIKKADRNNVAAKTIATFLNSSLDRDMKNPRRGRTEHFPKLTTRFS